MLVSRRIFMMTRSFSPATPRWSGSGRDGTGRWSMRSCSDCCLTSGGGACSIWAAAAGSSRTISPRAALAHPRVTYTRAALEDVEFAESRFDLIVSVLAFHYVDDYAGLWRRIARWLAPGGILVYSTEHPLYNAR